MRATDEALSRRRRRRARPRVARSLVLLLVLGGLGAALGLRSLPTGDLGSAGSVVGIADGDTLSVLRGGAAVKVRLAEIDCPERGQPFGDRARQRTSELAYGKIIQVFETDSPDRWGRLIGEVILPDGRSLNRELVGEGLAWHYRAYSTSAELGALEAEARRRGAGLWADAHPVPPWEWRKQRR